MENHPELERRLWLFSRRADFWLACGGASAAVLAAVALIFLHGDREIDAIDFVLSEFHLGATYDAVLRRRLWRRRPVDVLAIPSAILARQLDRKSTRLNSSHVALSRMPSS